MTPPNFFFRLGDPPCLCLRGVLRFKDLVARVGVLTTCIGSQDPREAIQVDKSFRLGLKIPNPRPPLANIPWFSEHRANKILHRASNKKDASQKDVVKKCWQNPRHFKNEDFREINREKMKNKDFSLFSTKMKMPKSSFFIFFIFRPHFSKPTFRA